ncbi:DEAD/DEAH box helicase [Cellulomonas sp. Leaf334]|uniref:DEAD/DEAH box helicase n=1 Tax=Cellulomonas sp. Leaf334 TaxID=1736339 RepID=UPI0006FF157E|nr:DEAD/DEAH box helicase [Cellulomonas sp. Leaf334]KQR10437.1 hypothetical protein ASF78_17270 [Cellulomonas sp. Leaf334]
MTDAVEVPTGPELTFDLRGVQLEDWQQDACAAWAAGDEGGPFRGTLEVFTGGGKSLIALECARLAALVEPHLRLVIVVPTIALARQWRAVLEERTGLDPKDIGELRGGRKDDLRTHRALIGVLNSAAQRLPQIARDARGPLMLIVDESHRAGAPEFSRVLDTPADFRLGLSATAEREDVDDDGVAVEYDDHVLGRNLGAIVYRFDLRSAREIGWLPTFTVHHHAVQLDPDERRRYDEASRKIDDLADRLRDIGVDMSAVRVVAGRSGEQATLARSYVAAVSTRKDLLYRARERTRVSARIVESLASRTPGPRILLFHERIDEAVDLHAALSRAGLGVVALEHSRLSDSRRRQALASFADGSAPILVSVKSLVEGIDVPATDVGVSVASSASVRQRVQALGRVLRRRFDGGEKTAEMHLLFVEKTADELIYEKEDWSDLTGPASNQYFGWGLDAVEPDVLDGPPRTPRPTEDQFWTSFTAERPTLPIEWPCGWPRDEWRLDSRGSVTDLSGALVENPQGVVAAVQRLRPGGGRFRVSTKHRFVVVPEAGSELRAWCVDVLDEPFRTRPAEAMQDEGPVTEDSTPAEMTPGDPYLGPRDRTGGTYKIRQKRGGVITRRVRTGEEYAAADPGEGTEPQVSNAVLVLDAWKRTGESGISFFVNARDVAYYLSGGEARYLAHVDGGFLWPTPEGSEA